MARRQYNLVVTYDADFWFEDDNMDQRIEKVVGKTAGGSGMGFGERDLSFWFRSLSKAQDAELKLLRARRRRNSVLGKCGLSTSLDVD